MVVLDLRSLRFRRPVFPSHKLNHVSYWTNFYGKHVHFVQYTHNRIVWLVFVRNLVGFCAFPATRRARYYCMCTPVNSQREIYESHKKSHFRFGWGMNYALHTKKWIVETDLDCLCLFCVHIFIFSLSTNFEAYEIFENL